MRIVIINSVAERSLPMAAFHPALVTPQQPAPRAPVAPPAGAPEVLSSERLLQGRREILIRHGDSFYRLRHTSSDKLILTK